MADRLFSEAHLAELCDRLSPPDERNDFLIELFLDRQPGTGQEQGQPVRVREVSPL